MCHAITSVQLEHLAVQPSCHVYAPDSDDIMLDFAASQSEMQMEILLEKTHQLQCIVNRELVFDATAKVAFMLNQDLDMFNKLKRQEVSFMLHIQPETLSRVLKRLTRNGVIQIDNGNVIIVNHDSLSSIFKGVGV